MEVIEAGKWLALVKRLSYYESGWKPVHYWVNIKPGRKDFEQLKREYPCHRVMIVKVVYETEPPLILDSGKREGPL